MDKEGCEKCWRERENLACCAVRKSLILISVNINEKDRENLITNGGWNLQ